VLTRKSGADVISFTALGKYNIHGTLDAQHRVTRVPPIANPVLGDMDLIAEYSEYRPSMGCSSRQGSRLFRWFSHLGLTITRVTPNAPRPPGA
jgi:hypothetical protein